jgi:hypothetical protein
MVSYMFSSWTAVVLFTYTWRIYRVDRTQLKAEPAADENEALRRAVAWRNEYIGGAMAVTSWLTAFAATLILIRIFEVIYLPWEPGLVTFFFLAFANFLEMTVAGVILIARIQMNRERE